MGCCKRNPKRECKRCYTNEGFECFFPPEGITDIDFGNNGWNSNFEYGDADGTGNCDNSWNGLVFNGSLDRSHLYVNSHIGRSIFGFNPDGTKPLTRINFPIGTKQIWGTDTHQGCTVVNNRLYENFIVGSIDADGKTQRNLNALPDMAHIRGPMASGLFWVPASAILEGTYSKRFRITAGCDIAGGSDREISWVGALNPLNQTIPWLITTYGNIVPLCDLSENIASLGIKLVAPIGPYPGHGHRNLPYPFQGGFETFGNIMDQTNLFERPVWIYVPERGLQGEAVYYDSGT